MTLALGAPAAHADSGSVTDIRATGATYGAPLQATFSATFDTCSPGAYCGWWPTAVVATGDGACTPYGLVWVGALQSAPGTVTETKTFFPAREGSNKLCVYINRNGTEYKVAEVVFDYRAGSPSPPPGSAPPATRTDKIPSYVGVQGDGFYFVNDYVGPADINAARFVQLAKATGSRWGLAYVGTTRAYPVRDGVNTVGFSFGVPEGTLGVTIDYLRNKYRRKRLCRTHRHSNGKRHRHCRLGKRRKVGRVWTGETDVQINGNVDWDQGPYLPRTDLFDLETTLIHEMGHFAGNDHVSGCVNSPMIDAIDTGEWWRGTNDWGRYGCSSSRLRRHGAGAKTGRLVRITVPPGERGPMPVKGHVPHLHR